MEYEPDNIVTLKVTYSYDFEEVFKQIKEFTDKLFKEMIIPKELINGGI